MIFFLLLQVTIVIKYFFQFGFFPFNQNKIDKNKPYHPPNIIGVEKKDGYVHNDLVQLLALFFHRSILKVRQNIVLPPTAKTDGIQEIMESILATCRPDDRNENKAKQNTTLLSQLVQLALVFLLGNLHV